MITYLTVRRATDISDALSCLVVNLSSPAVLANSLLVRFPLLVPFCDDCYRYLEIELAAFLQTSFIVIMQSNIIICVTNG